MTLMSYDEMNNSTNVLKLLDVVGLVGYNADGSTILKEIIEHYDAEIANGIRNNKVAKIPYIGNIRRNQLREEFRKSKSVIRLTDIRKTMTKKEYKEYTKQLYISASDRAKREDRLKVIFKTNRALHRNLYLRLCATAGKPYADCYIYCMGLMKVVSTPEVENKFKFKYKMK